MEAILDAGQWNLLEPFSFASAPSGSGPELGLITGQILMQLNWHQPGDWSKDINVALKTKTDFSDYSLQMAILKAIK